MEQPTGRDLFLNISALILLNQLLAVWVKLPPNPDFGGMSRHFQAKCVKNSNFYILKTTTSIATKFAQ